MQRFALILSTLLLLTACGGEEKKPVEQAPTLAPAVIKKNPKKAAKDPTPKSSKPKAVKKKESFEEKLSKDLVKVQKLRESGDYDKALEALAERLGDRPRDQWSSEDSTVLGRALQLEARLQLTRALIVKLSADIYKDKGSRAMITTGAGRQFTGWVLERYRGEADKEDLEVLDIARFDGIPMKLPKDSADFRRLGDDEWLESASAWLENRATQFKADGDSLELFRIAIFPYKWGAFKLFTQWLDRALDSKGSEILLTLHSKSQDSEKKQLRATLLRLTGGRSKIERKPVAIARAPIKPKSSPDETPVKPDLKPTADPKPDPALTSTNDANSPNSAVNLSTSEILELYDRGLKYYRAAADRRTQQQNLEKAQKTFSRAMEAWNNLSEKNPDAAAKIEDKISEMGTLHYDCIKRMKIK